MKKQYVILFLKLIFATAVIAWLMRGGLLDFKLLKDLLKTPWILASALLLTGVQLALNSYRWQHIVKHQEGIDLSFAQAFKMSWISAFFCSFLPGSVTGDLVKFGHLKSIRPKLLKKAFLSYVFLDRLSGLVAIILLSAVFSLNLLSPQYSWSNELRSFFLLLTILGAVLILALLLFPFFKKLQVPLIQKILLPIRFNPFIAVSISVLSQSLILVIFFLLSQSYLTDISYFKLIPFILIGFVSTALPIAPSGIGVGHAAFAALFNLVGIQSGASLFNLYLFVSLAFNLLGVFAFLSRPKKA